MLLEDCTRVKKRVCVAYLTLERMVIKDCQGRGLISKIYTQLVDQSPETFLNKLEAKREDLQVDLPPK